MAAGKPVDLDRLEALLGAATPGEWQACGCRKCGLVWAPPDSLLFTGGGGEDCPSLSGEQTANNRDLIVALRNAAPALLAELRAAREELESRGSFAGGIERVQARPLAEWHEDHGDCLWWKFPVVEPPYVGSPLDDDFPDYLTHWTRIVVPKETP